MNASKFLGCILLFSLGLTLILEGIFLNYGGIIYNDGSFLIEGAGLIFLGALGLSTSFILYRQIFEEV